MTAAVASGARQQDSSLALLVPRITADHVDTALAPHHLAVLTHPLDAGPYFHGSSPRKMPKRMSINPLRHPLQGLRRLILENSSQLESHLAYFPAAGWQDPCGRVGQERARQASRKLITRLGNSRPHLLRRSTTAAATHNGESAQIPRPASPTRQSPTAIGDRRSIAAPARSDSCRPPAAA